MSIEEQYDEAMYTFSCGDFAGAAAQLRKILAIAPANYEAQLGLAMTYGRLGDFAAAIAAGHQAERLNPKDPLVHTNLSVFYLKQGDKARAEHHAAQARIASWRQSGQAAPAAVPPEPTTEGQG